jgi:hypothetical protein
VDGPFADVIGGSVLVPRPRVRLGERPPDRATRVRLSQWASVPICRVAVEAPLACHPATRGRNLRSQGLASFPAEITSAHLHGLGRRASREAGDLGVQGPGLPLSACGPRPAV